MTKKDKVKKKNVKSNENIEDMVEERKATLQKYEK